MKRERKQIERERKGEKRKRKAKWKEWKGMERNEFYCTCFTSTINNSRERTSKVNLQTSTVNLSGTGTMLKTYQLTTADKLSLMHPCLTRLMKHGPSRSNFDHHRPIIISVEKNVRDWARPIIQAASGGACFTNRVVTHKPKVAFKEFPPRALLRVKRLE